MNKPSASLAQINPWDELRRHTSARIALGRAGASLPSAEILKFGLAHAQARDAVHHRLDFDAIQAQLRERGLLTARVHSQAVDRHTYLLRPDLGRRLALADDEALRAAPPASQIAIVLADGLSAFAIERHAIPLLDAFRRRYDTDWMRTPIVLAEQARVALGDDIGAALRAKLVIVFIGERPGLTSPDSLGIYITYAPRTGRMDSERNCISNVRPQGLPYEQAAAKLAYLIQQSLVLQLTGVGLKDNSGVDSALIETVSKRVL